MLRHQILTHASSSIQALWEITTCWRFILEDLLDVLVYLSALLRLRGNATIFHLGCLRQRATIDIAHIHNFFVIFICLLIYDDYLLLWSILPFFPRVLLIIIILILFLSIRIIILIITAYYLHLLNLWIWITERQQLLLKLLRVIVIQVLRLSQWAKVVEKHRAAIMDDSILTALVLIVIAWRLFFLIVEPSLNQMLSVVSLNLDNLIHQVLKLLLFTHLHLLSLWLHQSSQSLILLRALSPQGSLSTLSPWRPPFSIRALLMTLILLTHQQGSTLCSLFHVLSLLLAIRLIDSKILSVYAIQLVLLQKLKLK